MVTKKKAAVRKPPAKAKKAVAARPKAKVAEQQRKAKAIIKELSDAPEVIYHKNTELPSINGDLTYSPSMVIWIERFGRLGRGLEVKDLAMLFDVPEKTIKQWMKEHIEFKLAIEESTEVSNRRVELALFNRAIGYDHRADRVTLIGNKLHVKPYTKHYPPDTAAAIFWLKNKDPENWKERVEFVPPPNTGFRLIVEDVDPVIDGDFTAELGVDDEAELNGRH
jgi:hypothetical protein